MLYQVQYSESFAIVTGRFSLLCYDWSFFLLLSPPDLQKVEEIEKVMDRDFYMTAQEAIDFGVVDKILSKRPKEGVGSGIVE